MNFTLTTRQSETINVNGNSKGMRIAHIWQLLGQLLIFGNTFTRLITFSVADIFTDDL